MASKFGQFQVKETLASLTQQQNHSVLFVLGLLYLGLAIAHWLFISDPNIRYIMTLIALVSALCIEVLVYYAKRSQRNLAYVLQASTAIVIFGNSLAHIYFTKDILQTTNLLIAFMGIGAIGAHRAIFYSSLAIATTCWTIIVFSIDVPDTLFMHFAFGVVISVAASLMIFRHRVGVLDQLIEQKTQTEFFANFDPMSGCLRRHSFDNKASQVLSLVKPDQAGVGMLYCDLDYFKKLNDNCGHAIGDNALEQTGKIIASFAHRYGLVAGRTGGEEFSLIGPMSQEQCTRYAQELVDSIVAEQIPHPYSPICDYLTASVGFVHQDAQAPLSLDKLSLLSDQALYEAKRLGRNQAFGATK